MKNCTPNFHSNQNCLTMPCFYLKDPYSKAWLARAKWGLGCPVSRQQVGIGIRLLLITVVIINLLLCLYSASYNMNKSSLGIAILSVGYCQAQYRMLTLNIGFCQIQYLVPILSLRNYWVCILYIAVEFWNMLGINDIIDIGKISVPLPWSNIVIREKSNPSSLY